MQRKSFDDPIAVREAVEGSLSVREALSRMGYTGRLHKYYPRLKTACAKHEIPYPAHRSKDATSGSPRKRYAVFDDESRLRRASHGASSRSQILKSLGLSVAQKNYVSLEKAAARYGIPLPGKRAQSNASVIRKAPWFFDEKTFRNAVENSESGNEVMRRLGVSRDRAWLVRAAEYHNVTLPVGKRGGGKGGRKATPLEEVLVEGSVYPPVRLKRRLVDAGYLLNRCATCHTPPEWNGLPLTLQLDHINGVHDDNRLHNLRLLCPNCHSQSETYAGRNKRRTSTA